MRNKKNHIDIKNPCHLKWNSLEGNSCERFCSSCATPVVDLTQKSNSEIIGFVMKQKGRVCGRIRQDQVDRILLQNRTNTSLIKAFFVFVLGFATITTSQATTNQSTSSPLEHASKSNLNSNKGIKPNLRIKQDPVIKYSGQVLDAGDKSQLPGVNVILKGTDIGTKTDIYGNFELEITKDILNQQNHTLIFSYIGFIELGA